MFRYLFVKRVITIHMYLNHCITIVVYSIDEYCILINNLIQYQ